jgi:translocation and assembly module TamB
MKRMLHLLVRLMLDFVVAIAALMIVLYALVATPYGSHAAVALAQRFSGGAFSAGAASGTLSKDFELRQVHIAIAGTDIRADRLHLRWRPHELLQRRLHITAADIDALAIAVAPTRSSTQNAGLPTRLPIDIAIDSLRVHGFSYSESQKPMLQLDDAELALRWLDTHVDIDRLATALARTGPLQLEAHARLAPDRISFEQIHIAAAGGAVDAEGVFGIDTVASDLRLRWHDLHWPPTAATVEKVRFAGLGGEARLAGILKNYNFELSGEALMHDVHAQLSAHGSGSLDALRIDAATLRAEQATASVSGDVAWSPQVRAILDIRTEHLDPALFAANWKGDINAHASTQTTVVDGKPRIRFSADVANSKLRGYPLALTVRGYSGADTAHIDEAKLQVAQGTVTAQGTVAWLPALSVDADLQLSRLNPAAFAPRWTGNLNGSVHLRTTRTGGVPDIAFDAQLAQSVLRDYPLTLSSQGDVRSGAVTLQSLTLASGATRLSASGRVTAPFAAEAHLNSPDLAALYPGLGGRLAFDATLSGERDNPHLLTHGSAVNLSYLNYRVGRAAWDADAQPHAPSRLEVNADNASVGLAIVHARLAMEGLETYHRTQFDATTERGDISATFQGGYDRKRKEWGGQIAALRLAPQNLPAWSLQQPAGLLLGARRRSLEPACVASDGARACLNMQRAVLNPGLIFGWSLQAVKLEGFKPLLPPQLDMAGRLDGNGEVHWLDGNISDAKADLHLSQAHIAKAGAPALDIDPATLHVDQNHDRLHAMFELRSPRGTVGAEATAAPAARLLDRELSGQMHVEVPDLSFVQPFVRELRTIGGRIDGKLDVAGTLGQPRLTGEVALHEGSAQLATPGINITGIEVRVSGNGNGPLTLDGHMHSGGGTLNLAGTVDPTQAPLNADLNLNGDSFQAMATRDARIWVTPALRFTNDAGGAVLNGALIVPKADITPQGFGGDGGVSTSEDQVIVGTRESAPPPKPLKLSSIVAFQLGDAVNFKGFGLTTRLEGTVVVFDQPPRPVRAQGEVRLVEGHYKAYGQNLSIETGRLIFTGGGVTTPAVDLYATRHPREDITVGVRVRGTLDKPMLTLDSDPAMAREQQLSWLLLGRPLDQNSTSDRNLVSSAALSLGLTGGDYLVKQLGKRIGIDEVSVGAAPAGGSDVAADPTLIAGSQAAQQAPGTPLPSTSQSAQLTLGKYLTPRLFVSYGVSLFEPGQTFRLLYDLGHGFKVESEAGVANGADLIYTIERGH